MTKWDKKFIELSDLVASWSKDESSKLGAVIVDSSNRVVSMGYNGLPQGLNDDIKERHERPQKYLWFEHAERNAIYTAAKKGISLDGCTIYYNDLFTCADCARAIIQCGISTVVCREPDWDNPRWKDSYKVSKEMLEEAGIEIKLL